MRKNEDGYIITVEVTPKASKNEVFGFKEGKLKVRLTTAPEKGKANQALIKLLSEYYNIQKSKVFIIKGLTSRIKRILLKTNKL